MIVGLAGGVGGAKLARGLAQIAGTDLSVIVNTGDDFDHFGLRICPDLDTVTYTLAGKANPITGWGLDEETWSFMAQIKALGGEDWFQLGDRAHCAKHGSAALLILIGMRFLSDQELIAAAAMRHQGGQIALRAGWEK